MSQKKFDCKMEELPVITGFVAESLLVDLALFKDYSPEFNEELVEQIKTKRNVCLELESSNISVKRLKNVTSQLVEKEKGLRPILNKIEGYVKLAAPSLDVQVEDFGIGIVRESISRGNDEGVISGAKTLLKNATRNLTALQAKGLKQEVVDQLSAEVDAIDQLNNEQNSLMNTRSRVSADNVKDYNELWDLLKPVLDTARAMFRGVDDVKLKAYTISQLQKRVNAEGGGTASETKGGSPA